ncbi:serine/arginine repetitive matrix protein 1-like [Capsicum annuum]
MARSSSISLHVRSPLLIELCEIATSGEHRSPIGPDPISQPENQTSSYSRGASASSGRGASASSGRSSSPPRSAATVNNHPSPSFPLSGDNSHRRQQPAPPSSSTPNPRTAVIIVGQPSPSLHHRSSPEPDLRWVLVSCCLLVYLGFVYFLVRRR